MKTALTTLCLATFLGCPPLQAEAAPKDPLKNGSSTKVPDPWAPGESSGSDRSVNISIRYETFSLSLVDAAALQREKPGDTELYTKLIAMVARKEAKQESLIIVRSRSGQKSTVESISEQMYPTEFETPKYPEAIGASFLPRKAHEEPKAEGTPPPKPSVVIPDTAALASPPPVSDLAGLGTPATPTSFETRNVGDTLEVEPTLSDNGQAIDLRLVPDRVYRAGTSVAGQGLSRTEMPEFESQRLNTSVTLQTGKTFLLGTVNRPPVSKVDADSGNRIWFAFVTADHAQP